MPHPKEFRMLYSERMPYSMYIGTNAHYNIKSHQTLSSYHLKKYIYRGRKIFPKTFGGNEFFRYFCRRIT